MTETAVNIGYSCRLLTDEMEEVFTVDGESYDDVLGQLTRAQVILNSSDCKQQQQQQLSGAGGGADVDDRPGHLAGDSVAPISSSSYSNGNMASVAAIPVSVSTNSKNGTTTRLYVPEEPPRYAMVIGGHSLVIMSIFMKLGL